MSEELPPLPSIPFGASLGDILGKVQMGNDLLTRQNADEATKPPKVTIETDDETGKPITTISNIDHESLTQVMQALNFQKQAMAGYQEELGRLDQQEKNLSHGMGPIFNAIATVGGNLAVADPRLPPIVRALGQSSKELNPTLRQVQDRKLGVLSQINEMGTQQAATVTSLNRERRLEEKADEAAAEAQRRDNLVMFKDLSDQAQRGQLSNAGLAKKVLKGMDPQMSDDEAQAQADQLVTISKEAKDLQAAAEATKDENARLAYQRQSAETDKKLAAMLKAVEVRTAPALKTQEDVAGARTRMAKAIAEGDATSIRGISSFRGNERLLLMDEIKKFNPDLSEADINARVKAVESLGSTTNGSYGAQLQSLDTFVQHADELNTVLNTFKTTKSPLLNKSILWLRKNAAGDPEVQRLLVAIEPVGKEYESFLLNNRALYAEDRLTVKSLLSGEMNADQMRTALNQMTKTVKDRYIAANAKYKRTVGQPFPDDSISDEGKAAAARVGVPLGLVAPAGQGAVPSQLSPAEQAILADFQAGKITADEARKRRAALGAK